MGSIMLEIIGAVMHLRSLKHREVAARPCIRRSPMSAAFRPRGLVFSTENEYGL